jgi:hypothetical protein
LPSSLSHRCLLFRMKIHLALSASSAKTPSSNCYQAKASSYALAPVHSHLSILPPMHKILPPLCFRCKKLSSPCLR